MSPYFRVFSAVLSQHAIHADLDDNISIRVLYLGRSRGYGTVPAIDDSLTTARGELFCAFYGKLVGGRAQEDDVAGRFED